MRTRQGVLVFSLLLGLGVWGCITSNSVVLKSKEAETDSLDTERDSSNGTDTSDTDHLPAERNPLGIVPNHVLDWSTAYPFIDIMKQSREWYDWDNGDGDRFDLDENGWVRSLEPGQTAGTVFLVNDGATPVYSRVVVRYDGRGTIVYDWSAEKVEEESSPGRDVVDISTGNHLLKITETDPDDYLRNISIVPEGMEGHLAAGETFSPVWLDRMTMFGTIRFSLWTVINASEQEEWADRPLESHRTWSPKGVPYSVMIDLANRLEVSPWFTVPHGASLDYVRRLALLIEENLASDISFYVEHSHAPWDPRYPQYTFAKEAGESRFGSGEDRHLTWHGARTAEICDVFKTDVFDDGPERVICVMSLPVDQPDKAAEVLECPAYVEEEADREPCYAHGIDAVAVSAFFDGCLQDDLYIDDIYAWFEDDDGGIERGMQQLEDGRHFPDCDRHIGAMASKYARFSSIADGYGLFLLAYEGGQEITAEGTPHQDEPQLIDFHLELNRDDGMRERYLEHFDAWKASGGRLFMHFTDAALPSKYGSFGALETITDTTSPKWEALEAFEAAGCWWEGC